MGANGLEHRLPFALSALCGKPHVMTKVGFIILKSNRDLQTACLALGG